MTRRSSSRASTTSTASICASSARHLLSSAPVFPRHGRFSSAHSSRRRAQPLLLSLPPYRPSSHAPRILDNLPVGMVKMREDNGLSVKMYERGYPVGFEAAVVEARNVPPLGYRPLPLRTTALESRRTRACRSSRPRIFQSGRKVERADRSIADIYVPSSPARCSVSTLRASPRNLSCTTTSASRSSTTATQRRTWRGS